MSDDNEMILLLKELVDKVKNLEQAVYNKDNLLMKSGFVVAESPTPHMTNNTTVSSGYSIAKMEWDDIHKMANNLG